MRTKDGGFILAEPDIDGIYPPEDFKKRVDEVIAEIKDIADPEDLKEAEERWQLLSTLQKVPRKG